MESLTWSGSTLTRQRALEYKRCASGSRCMKNAHISWSSCRHWRAPREVPARNWHVSLCWPPHSQDCTNGNPSVQPCCAAAWSVLGEFHLSHCCRCLCLDLARLPPGQRSAYQERAERGSCWAFGMAGGSCGWSALDTDLGAVLHRSLTQALAVTDVIWGKHQQTPL